jgi:hypothetical protein
MDLNELARQEDARSEGEQLVKRRWNKRTAFP